MKTEALIFDMDGTLWDSAANVAASWTEALKKEPDINRIITEEDMKSVMGITMTEIGERLFPDVSPKRREEIVELCGIYENEYLKLHGGKVYDGVPETLAKLSKSHRLFIVSNCQCGYIEAFLECYGLGRFFEDTLCWGDTQVMKGENIQRIMKKNHVKDAAYVGDIQGDADSARFAGIKFIHAAYGFGTVQEKDAEIRRFPELLQILEI